MEVQVDLYLTILEVTDHLQHLQRIEAEPMLTLAQEDLVQEVIILQEIVADHLQRDLTAAEAADLTHQVQDLTDLQEATDLALHLDHHLEVSELVLLQEVVLQLEVQAEVREDKYTLKQYLIRRLNENLIAFFIFNNE